MPTHAASLRQQKAERVTLIGSALDLALGVVKIVIGVIGHSTALVADGVHSLSDLATDFMVVLVMRHAAKAPDQQHPFGHQRFETVGTVVMGLVLTGVAAGMAWQSIQQLIGGDVTISPTWPVLVAAAVSIISKEWIYRYTVKVGRELKSDLIIANAWHSRSDAFSSVVVFVAVAGAMLGAVWLDALAAVIVALMIAKIGWDMVIKNLSELVDTGLPAEQLTKIQQAALAVAGVEEVHNLRGRTMAGQALLELHLVVGNQLSASEAHFIGNQVRDCLLRDFDNIQEVIFHIDTRSNQLDDKSLKLPARADIVELLAPLLNDDYQLTLYYASDKVSLELKLHSAKVTDIPALQASLTQVLQQQPWFGQLSVWRSE